MTVDNDKQIVVSQTPVPAVQTGVDALLARIRPEWRAKSLIHRVDRLFPVDPSSACQRVFNAAIHDLREKVVIAGMDIASEAANAHKLPSVTKPEDILDSYSPSSIIDLAYRIGLLTRPEWRRLSRAYDIRRDLEHEDDEYEATPEDVFYIFTTCVEVVLSRYPMELLRVDDVKQLIEKPGGVTPAIEFLHDYESAPNPRQKDIAQFLVNTAVDNGKPDVTRQNAVEALRSLAPFMRDAVKIELAGNFDARFRAKPVDLLHLKVAHAGGFTPYLKHALLRVYFRGFHSRLSQVGFVWTKNLEHIPLLDELEDVGGLAACPSDVRSDIVLWMTRCYLGVKGGYGQGTNRPVFFSNSAAPRVEKIFKQCGPLIQAEVEAASQDKEVIKATAFAPIGRRMEQLQDIVAETG